MSPEDCPRFDKCSANICPADADRGRRVHLPGEPVCFYLTETVKDGAAARFEGRPDEEFYRRATEVASQPELLGATIRHKLNQAALTGSRIDNGQRLAQSGNDLASASAKALQSPVAPDLLSESPHG